MGPIRKILVPTDFSPHAQEAFRVAHDLARATGAGVVVFHVSRPPAVVSDGHSALSTPAAQLGRPQRHRGLPDGPARRLESSCPQ